MNTTAMKKLTNMGLSSHVVGSIDGNDVGDADGGSVGFIVGSDYFQNILTNSLFKHCRTKHLVLDSQQLLLGFGLGVSLEAWLECS